MKLEKDAFHNTRPTPVCLEASLWHTWQRNSNTQSSLYQDASSSPSPSPSPPPLSLSLLQALQTFSATKASKAGVRIGCAISASAKCKPPWWKTLFGANTMDLNEREQCEVREMAACLDASKESCIQFAREKCLPAFRDARIAMADQKGIPKRMFRGSPNGDSDPTSAANTSESPDRVVTNYGGSVLLGSGSNPKDSKN